MMARSKPIPGGKASRTTKNKNQEQAVTGDPVESTEVTAPADTPPQELRQAAIAVPAATTASESTMKETRGEPRKLEVVREVARNDSRKNLVPINLEDEIRQRAFELYQQRGGSGSGSEAEDWLAAEREVLQRYRQQSA